MPQQEQVWFITGLRVDCRAFAKHAVQCGHRVVAFGARVASLRCPALCSYVHTTNPEQINADMLAFFKTATT
jgi:hypothetical protein